MAEYQDRTPTREARAECAHLLGLEEVKGEGCLEVEELGNGAGREHVATLSPGYPLGKKL
jgi:hypothetical protein